MQDFILKMPCYFVTHRPQQSAYESQQWWHLWSTNDFQ